HREDGKGVEGGGRAGGSAVRAHRGARLLRRRKPPHILQSAAGVPVAPPRRRDGQVTRAQAPTRLRTASKSRTGRTSMLPVPIHGNSCAIFTASSRLSASIRL